MPDVEIEEPLWVQRMRAEGYNIRIGNSGEPMSEIPEAMFPPPMHPLRRTLAWIPWGIRKLVRLGAFSRNGRHAPFP